MHYSATAQTTNWLLLILSSGLINNQSVVSASFRSKRLSFPIAGPHNDTFCINNQVTTPQISQELFDEYIVNC